MQRSSGPAPSPGGSGPPDGPTGTTDDERLRFEALFRDSYPAVLGYVLRRTTDPADAADVVAETFLVAWRRLPDLLTAQSPRPWLFGVARNVLANHDRSRSRRDGLARRLAEHLAVAAERAAPADAGHEHLDRVRAALAGLPEGDREVLTLVAWEGLSRDEVATALGCSRATARVRLHRARRRLTRALDASSAGTTIPNPHTEEALS